jgi:hypothetical protein
VKVGARLPLSKAPASEGGRYKTGRLGADPGVPGVRNYSSYFVAKTEGRLGVVLLKRTLIVNAEESVVVQNLMLAQWRQDLIGEFAEFCSGNEL